MVAAIAYFPDAAKDIKMFAMVMCVTVTMPFKSSNKAFLDFILQQCHWLPVMDIYLQTMYIIYLYKHFNVR